VKISASGYHGEDINPVIMAEGRGRAAQAVHMAAVNQDDDFGIEVAAGDGPQFA
jgi:hypothetical protein